METRTIERWAIVVNSGLCTGQERTKSNMINKHLLSLYGHIPEQRTKNILWLECKKRGDRAAKVTITYPI